MRILVVGGSGQVGQELAKLAWPVGVSVSAPPRGALDLADQTKARAAVAAEPWRAVINAAAYTAVDKAESDVETAWRVNALGPALLAAATREAGIPLIHVSTDYVFDGEKAGPYLESDPTGPLGVYGASKLGGEAAVRTANPRHVIVRTAWLVSAHGANFVKTMLRLAGERPSLRVVADQHGSPTSAADLAAVLATIALRTAADAAAPCGTYHFVNAGEATWYDFAREIFAMSAALGGPFATVTPIATSEYPTPARRPRNSRLSTLKIEHDFGIVPRPWQAATAEVVAALVGSRRTPGRTPAANMLPTPSTDATDHPTDTID